jgi:hypothetical protein
MFTRSITIKELFEYPELYINDFGYNVFNAVNTEPPANTTHALTDNNAFQLPVINVHEKDGQHPEEVSIADPTNHVYAEGSFLLITFTIP